MKFQISGLILLTSFFLTSTASSEPPAHVGLKIGADNLEIPWLELESGVSTESGHDFTLSARGALVRERFVGGYVVDEGLSFSTRLNARWLLKRGRTKFRLGTGIGLRHVISDTETVAGDSSTAVLASLTPSVSVDVSPDASLEFALGVNVGFAFAPEAELDTLGTPLSVTLHWRLGKRLSISPSVWAGGSFGYGGDGAKHSLGGSLGMTYAFADREEQGNESYSKPSSTAPFLSLGWRGLALADHLSHGPEFQVGVRLFDGYLKLGIAGFNRPGPLNPKRFKVESATGQAYKGSSTLDLKSDGGVVGILIGTTIPVLDWLALDIPVTVGQAGFGFYLAGEDRETPDGRRVSDWENELQDGRDSGFAIAFDLGMRAMFSSESMPWLRPYIGAHYTLTPGYDSFATSDFGGFSIASGVELVAF